MIEVAPSTNHIQARTSDLRAAAHQEMISRTASFACTSRQREIEIMVDLDTVWRWADQLSDTEVRDAYQWAINDIKRDVAERCALEEKRNRINAARETLPKPPR
jgi:hypothetical protein